MILERLILTAFGKFRGRELELGPGLNLIYGPNEAGKSTVQRFIYGMLYGFFKPGARRRVKLEEMERCQPWTGGEYRGALVLRAERTGRRLRVEREFGERAAVRVQDFDTGQGLRLPQDEGSREPLLGQELTGLSGEEFLRTACVGQNQVRIGEPGDLAARLANLQQTGREELSVQRVDRRLDERRRRAMDQIRRLREQWEPADAELRRLLRARDEYLSHAEQIHTLSRERAELRAERDQLALQRDQARLAEVERSLRTLREREEQLAALDARLGELTGHADFPAHRKAELLQLEGRAEELSLQWADAEQAARAAAEQLRAATEALEPLRALAQLPPDAPQQVRALLHGWEKDQADLARRRSNLGARRAAVARWQAELAGIRAVGDPGELERELDQIQARSAAAGAASPAGRVRQLQEQQELAKRRAGGGRPPPPGAGCRGAGCGHWAGPRPPADPGRRPPGGTGAGRRRPVGRPGQTGGVAAPAAAGRCGGGCRPLDRAAGRAGRRERRAGQGAPAADSPGGGPGPPGGGGSGRTGAGAGAAAGAGCAGRRGPGAAAGSGRAAAQQQQRTGGAGPGL